MKFDDFGSAPKDGREILVFYPYQNVFQIVRYNRVHKYWESKGEPKLGIENQDVVWSSLIEAEKDAILASTRSNSLKETA